RALGRRLAAHGRALAEVPGLLAAHRGPRARLRHDPRWGPRRGPAVHLLPVLIAERRGPPGGVRVVDERLRDRDPEVLAVVVVVPIARDPVVAGVVADAARAERLLQPRAIRGVERAPVVRGADEHLNAGLVAREDRRELGDLLAALLAEG